MWFKKMMRVISRGLSDIKELEKVEVEEAVRVERTSRSLGEGSSNVVYKFIGIEDRYYLSL